MRNDRNDTPLLYASEVDAWRDELAHVVKELHSNNIKADLLRQRLDAAEILITARKESIHYTGEIIVDSTGTGAANPLDVKHPAGTEIMSEELAGRARAATAEALSDPTGEKAGARLADMLDERAGGKTSLYDQERAKIVEAKNRKGTERA